MTFFCNVSCPNQKLVTTDIDCIMTVLVCRARVKSQTKQIWLWNQRYSPALSAFEPLLDGNYLDCYNDLQILGR